MCGISVDCVGLRTRGWGLETRLLRLTNFRPRRGMTLTLSNHMAYRFLVTFNYAIKAEHTQKAAAKSRVE